MNYIYLAEDALDAGKPLKALHYFLKAYEVAPDDDLLIDIALLYQELGDTQKAYETFQRILEQNPEECIAYYGLATLLDEEEKYLEAIPYYEQAVALNPFYDRAYFFLAGAYDATGQPASAITAYERVLELVPMDFWALTNLGAIYEEMGSSHKAYHYFKQAHHVDGNHYIANFNLAVVYGKLGQVKEALYFYTKAIHANKDYAYSYLNLAVLYKEHGQIEKGLRVLDAAVLHAPESFIYYNRACFHALLGHIDASLADLKVAYTASSGFIDYSKTDPDLQPILPLVDF